jgi:hypothetical protein
MIHNLEVAGSCPALATENQEVTKTKIVTSFYLHVRSLAQKHNFLQSIF